MSVSSILAFVLLGTRAFTGPRDRPDEKPTRPSYAELKAKCAELEGERDRQYEANAVLIARIAELEGDVHRANIQYRHDQDIIDMWRERALSVPPADFRPAQIAQQQSQMLQAQYAHGLAGMGMLGAQTLIDAELWCNCVPSRSQVWAATDHE